MAFEIKDGVLLDYIPEDDETIAVIPEGVTDVVSGAFNRTNCRKLKKIVLPKSLKHFEFSYRFKYDRTFMEFHDIAFVLYGVCIFLSVSYKHILMNVKYGDIHGYNDTDISGYEQYSLVKYLQKMTGCNIGVKDDCNAESLNLYFFEDYIKEDDTVDYDVYFNSLNRYYNNILKMISDGIVNEINCILKRDFSFILERYLEGWIYLHHKGTIKELIFRDDIYKEWKKQYNGKTAYISNEELHDILQYIVLREPDNADAKLALDLVTDSFDLI